MAALAPCIIPTVKQSKSSRVCPFYQECKRFLIGISPVEFCVGLINQNSLTTLAAREAEKGDIWPRMRYISAMIKTVLWSVRGKRSWIMGWSQESRPY